METKTSTGASGDDLALYAATQHTATGVHWVRNQSQSFTHSNGPSLWASKASRYSPSSVHMTRRRPRPITLPDQRGFIPWPIRLFIRPQHRWLQSTPVLSVVMAAAESVIGY